MLRHASSISPTPKEPSRSKPPRFPDQQASGTYTQPLADRGRVTLQRAKQEFKRVLLSDAAGLVQLCSVAPGAIVDLDE